jgi:hypothetical protein
LTEHSEVILARGKALQVVAIRSADGTCPALEFLDALTRRPRAQFRVLLERMAEDGRILGEERFRKLMVPSPHGQPEVWEFKAHDGPGWRLYAIPRRGDWIVTHGRRKPADRRVAAEAAKARMLYAAWRAR